jgi:hypothetical protein
MDNVHGRVVFGGTFPATIWRKYMQGVTDGMDVGTFFDPKSFPGKVLNSNLATTTSTTVAPKPSSSGGTSTTGSTTSSVPTTTAASPPTSDTTAKTTPSTSAAKPAGPGP